MNCVVTLYLLIIVCPSDLLGLVIICYRYYAYMYKRKFIFRCNELVSQLKTLLEEYRLLHQPPPRLQPLSAAVCNAFTATGGGGFRRTTHGACKDPEFLAEIKKSPSEKARIHSRHHLTVKVFIFNFVRR